jgi:hypothetical protein
MLATLVHRLLRGQQAVQGAGRAQGAALIKHGGVDLERRVIDEARTHQLTEHGRLLGAGELQRRHRDREWVRPVRAGQRNPFGQRDRNSARRHFVSVPYFARNAGIDRPF